LVLVLAIGQPASANQKHPANRNEIHQKAADKQPPAATLLQEVPPKPYIYPYSCDKPQSSEQDNLCIERRAAKAAEDQVNWSRYTFYIGCFGTAAVVATLVVTAIAARAAQTAAEATVLSVQAAQRSAVAAETAGHVERAWLFCDDIQTIEGSNVQFRGNSSEGYIFVIVWYNGGRTPATKIETTIMYEIIKTTDDIPSFHRDFFEVSGAICGQGRRIATNPAFISLEDIKTFRERTKNLVVYGRVEYFDIYNPTIKRFSELTVVVDFNGTKTNKSGETTDNIIVTPLGLQNRCF